MATVAAYLQSRYYNVEVVGSFKNVVVTETRGKGANLDQVYEPWLLLNP